MTNARMLPADAMFAAARQLGEQIAAQRAAHRQALKDARNARRRARRAASPKLAPKPKTPLVEVDYDVEVGCRCHVVQNPPCSWCENGGQIDEDGAS